jgi:hypothetical protein
LVRTRPLPAPPRARQRPAWLRLVWVNRSPRRTRAVAVKPALRLIRGHAPRIVSRPPLRRPRPALRQRSRSRAGQLAFVAAMAAVGLIALATSVGQILARAM